MGSQVQAARCLFEIIGLSEIHIMNRKFQIWYITPEINFVHSITYFINIATNLSVGLSGPKSKYLGGNSLFRGEFKLREETMSN